jgi:hypothetical protein
MSNDYDALSILTDTIPRGDYFDGFTWDEEEANAKDSKKVLLKVNPDGSGNPIPVMNDTQKTAVADMIKAQMDVQVKSVHKKSATKTERKEKKYEESKAFFDRFNKLNAGDESTFEAVSEEITQEYNNASDIKITKIKRNDDSFTVLLKDPEVDGIRTLTIDRTVTTDNPKYDAEKETSEKNPKTITKLRELEDVSQELYQYIKPTAGDNTFDEDISLYQPGFTQRYQYDESGKIKKDASGSPIPNPEFYDKDATFQRDKMYPENIELSQLIIEEGTGQQGDTTAIGLLKNEIGKSGAKHAVIATATERILNMGLGQFLEEDITIDSEAGSWTGLGGRGTVTINVGDKPYEIKWDKDVNRYGDNLESLMNQILGDLKEGISSTNPDPLNLTKNEEG